MDPEVEKGRIVQDTVIVLRTYSNNPDVENAVRNALYAARVARVYVIVKDDDPSHRGVIGRRLAGFTDPRLIVWEMCQGYSWANGLNGPLADTITRVDVAAEKIRFFVPASIEALWESEQLDRMLDRFDKVPNLFVVGPSFEGRFRDNDAKILLGPTYNLVRNTFCAYSLEALRRVGGWLPICDAHGGMEDAVAQMIAETLGFVCERLEDLSVVLVLGKNWSQPEKQAREEVAIRKNGAYLLSVADRMVEVYRRYCTKAGIDPDAAG